MGKKVRITTTPQPLTFEGLIKQMPALVDRLPNELLRKIIEFSIRAGVTSCKSCDSEEENNEPDPSLASLDSPQLKSLVYHQGESNMAQIPCRNTCGQQLPISSRHRNLFLVQNGKPSQAGYTSCLSLPPFLRHAGAARHLR